jgi:endoglucanase
MPFKIHRGTNISHWLSQSEARGAERTRRFTREDAARLAELGLDHLRLPVDEEQLWNGENRQEPEAWDLLQQGLDWCRAEGLRAVVDLHILRSHHFVDEAGANRLFSDPAEAERLGQCWRELSDALQSRDNDWVAYELMNEAVAEDPEDWNRVLQVPYHAIRENEPARFIAIGSNQWCQAKTFPDLRVPGNDDRIILVFHYYNPMLITHYKAPWVQLTRDYTGPVQYPGQPVSGRALAALPPDIRARIEQENDFFCIETMEQQLAPALKRSAELNLPLWCNEFGVINRTDDKIRKAWYRDFLSVLGKHNIPWTNWDFKGEFGLFDRRTNQATAVVEALLGGSRFRRR